MQQVGTPVEQNPFYRPPHKPIQGSMGLGGLLSALVKQAHSQLNSMIECWPVRIDAHPIIFREN